MDHTDTPPAPRIKSGDEAAAAEPRVGEGAIADCAEHTAQLGEAGAPAALPAGPLPDLEAVVDAWWRDRMPGSALARATEAWNHAYGALDDLKRRLAAALEQGE